MNENVHLKARPVRALCYSIHELSEDDMDNILIGLQLLMDSLGKESIQRIQADFLHHALKGQRAERKKVKRS